MAKIRVHELAKKLAIDNKSILAALEKLGVTGKSHSSSLDDHLIVKIKRVLLGYEVEAEPQAIQAPVRKKKAKTKEEEPEIEAPKVEEPKAEQIEIPNKTIKKQTKEEPVTPAPVAKPAKKATKKKVVIKLAEVQAAARMDKQIPQKLEDLSKIQESLAKAVSTATALKEGSEGGEELATGNEKTADEIREEKLKDQLAKEVSKEKLQKFSGKTFETLQQVQTRGRTPRGTGLQPTFPRGRGRRRPIKGRRMPFAQGVKQQKSGPTVSTAAPRKKDLRFREGTTVKEFAELIGQKVNDIIRKLMELGQMATLNQSLEADAAQLIAESFGIKIEPIAVETEATILAGVVDDEASLKPRSPVVTVMGHVDHGKTSLLDVIRKTRVTEGEAGGITQHIGAYRVPIKDRYITFLDTPGHAAFTAMRARGAKITDIVILVVAADDGVMPQTIEAIDHSRAADVPIVVAINKVDKPEANPDKVKAELAEHGLTPEEWGGNTIFCEVSAKEKIGIEQMLEMVILQADILELKANPERPASGTVIEARLDRGRGPVATMLVQTGTLKTGDVVLTGTMFGKVKTLNSDTGKKIESAGPSFPVEVMGISSVPSAGDPFVVLEDERKARQIAMAREEKQKIKDMVHKPKLSLDDLFRQIQEGEIQDLNILIKGDVHGSVEAVQDSLLKITHPEVKVNIIHALTGGITESDVMLANASNAIIIGFNVRPELKARQLSEKEGVDIRLYNVIYQAVDEVKQALEGMLAPTLVEKILGRAEVRQTFQVSRLGMIAGSYVLDGIISRKSSGVRVIRDNVVSYDGKLGSLKRFNDDAKEVATGYECGITIENFNDIKVGDIIENYIIESVATKFEEQSKSQE